MKVRFHQENIVLVPVEEFLDNLKSLPRVLGEFMAGGEIAKQVVEIPTLGFEPAQEPEV